MLVDGCRLVIRLLKIVLQGNTNSAFCRQLFPLKRALAEVCYPSATIFMQLQLPPLTGKTELLAPKLLCAASGQPPPPAPRILSPLIYIKGKQRGRNNPIFTGTAEIVFTQIRFSLFFSLIEFSFVIVTDCPAFCVRTIVFHPDFHFFLLDKINLFDRVKFRVKCLFWCSKCRRRNFNRNRFQSRK